MKKSNYKSYYARKKGGWTTDRHLKIKLALPEKSRMKSNIFFKNESHVSH